MMDAIFPSGKKLCGADGKCVSAFSPAAGMRLTLTFLLSSAMDEIAAELPNAYFAVALAGIYL